jgi:ABC-type Mn2+/Zn2+ transport system permease subunit
MNAVPQTHRADLIAGFLSAFSLALAGIAIVRTPGLLAPVAILLALVAARMSEAHRRLAAWAVAFSTLAFFVGMLIAIATDSRIF